MGVDFHDIDAIYISHCHADHVGGLPLILQSRYWMPKSDDLGKRILPKLFCTHNVWHEIKDFLNNEVKYIDDDIYGFVDLESFNCGFDWMGISFWTEKNSHIEYSRSRPESWTQEKPCYGLRFEYEGKKIAFTADTSKVYDMEEYDFIFHDCEAGAFKSGVHAHIDDIIEKHQTSKRKPKIYLTHFGKEGILMGKIRQMADVEPSYFILPIFKGEVKKL
jgi:ribonuclease BN (tRNA processing enzyme)